ncbi:hypothetical protein LPB137_01860 [Poseidonibacter parvus]|uniref:Porin domain-containing protein n=1 Tax=Poseidonibacter parvus TaxID=1850254 RepID=A0A1P8KJH3_9BACT|nr:major outer membrane protein [Poseidonibacter parvus]APW64674.1 hypothetical protein LPB137_01860 [Poseidonibacter parvus]
MKKIAKLSLVAAVAVAGLTNVNAASLEEAIKGVDVSGQFRFRFQEKKVDGESTATLPTADNNETGSDVEIEVGVKVPVTENVTAVFKIDNANDDADDANTKADVEIEDYYFSYNAGALTVNAGQQNIPGRITDGNQGDGIVALYNLGSATIGAAAFADHNVDSTRLDNSNSVLSAIAMGNVGPVSLLGQYATVADTVDTYNLKADANFDMVKVGVEYTESELDAATGIGAAFRDDRSTLKAYVAGNVGIVSGKLIYAKTGDNGSGSIDSQVSTAGLEAPAEYLLWNLGTSFKSDMEIYGVDASVAVTPKLSLRAAYVEGEVGSLAGKEVYEALGQISYKVSKNLNTYVRYAEFDSNGVNNSADGQRGRVEVKYSF